ncbi:MAG: TonB-dependent receptor [Bacteroidales bacterium]|nr:TonB-dependent receptor [Bacteroidales bacterium]
MSFNESNLSEYKISINGRYSTVEQAIAALFVNLPFRIKKIENVIVITPFNSNSIVSNRDFNNETKSESKIGDKKYIKGIIMSAVNGERLPYAYISLLGKGYYSDIDGGFTIVLQDDIPVSQVNRLVEATISYLGFTTITASLELLENNRIYLNPALSFLDTVTVKAYLNSKAMQSGSIAGLVRVNYNIAKFLPGNGDNSVFNLLRMMPGVRSSGEPSFLSVWGSTNGESVIRIDGFRIFSLNNFNEQISSINPFIVKEIVLNKGGYNATKGDATGAIVDIIGIDGNSFKPAFKVNINNLTMNLFASAPFAKRSVIMASYRQTYYNLYDIDKLNPYGRESNISAPISLNDVYIKPDYSFRDLNLRFNSLLNSNINLAASLYYAQDDFKYTLDYGDNTYDANESNNQYGFSFNLDKEWGGIAGKTSITGYYSSNLLEAESIKKYRSQNLLSVLTENLIGESGVDISHSYNTGKYGKLDVGISYKWLFDNLKDTRSSFGKMSVFINDNFVISNLYINLGLRVDSYLGKSFFQPRFQGTYKVNNDIKITASAGLYNQFINKVPYIDESNNYSYIWKIADNDNVPVISSFHAVLGASYTKRGWLVSTEGYLKNSSDILRFGRYRGSSVIVNTSIDVKGVDIFIDKEIKGSNIFISTSFSNVKESPQSLSLPEREYSPFEIKTGAVIALYPFYISSTFVFGSGYINPYKNAFGDEPVSNDYNRFDVSLNYKLTRAKFSLEAGVSILNLFNSSNYKYVDALPFASGGQSGVLNIYSQAVPFTPIVSVQIIF